MNDKELIQKLLDASSEIHKASLRKANYIICGASIGKHMKESFEEIDREEKKKNRNKKIDDLLNGE